MKFSVLLPDSLRISEFELSIDWPKVLSNQLGRENAVSDFLRKNFKTFVSTKEFLNKNYFEFQNQIMFCSLTNFGQNVQCFKSSHSFADYQRHKAQCGIRIFISHSDLVWNQFWGFLKYKISHFTTFNGSELWFLWIFALFEAWKFTKWTKFTAPKMTKTAIIALLVFTKWISRKISVIQKLWNFHTVQ